MQSLQELKSIGQLKTEKKKHDKIELLGKDKLNTIEVLTSKALIDLHISHDEFDSVNNALREYNEIKTKQNRFSSKCAICFKKINFYLK